MVISKRFIAHAILAFALPLTGCGLFAPEEAPPQPPPPPRTVLPPTSPENVLNNLAFAHENRSWDEYVDALSPEFLFVPSDADQQEGIEPFDYDEDIQSTENMFNNVDSIELQLTHQASVPSDRLEYPAEDGYRMILVSRVNMLVQTRTITDGEVLYLQIGGDPATFIFEPDLTQTPVEYRIRYQKDDS